MSNVNVNGSSVFWFDGCASAVIDTGTPNNGVSVPTNNWLGDNSFWYQGTPQGYLQGGTGTVADSPENIWMYETAEPETFDPNASRAFVVII